MLASLTETVVIYHAIGYNKSILRCSTTLVILNLQIFKRDSYIVLRMSSHHCAVEGRSESAVTHLALLGVKIQEPAFWESCEVYLYFHLQKTKAALRGCFLQSDLST